MFLLLEGSFAFIFGVREKFLNLRAAALYGVIHFVHRVWGRKETWSLPQINSAHFQQLILLSLLFFFNFNYRGIIDCNGIILFNPELCLLSLKMAWTTQALSKIVHSVSPQKQKITRSCMMHLNGLIWDHFRLPKTPSLLLCVKFQ